MFTLTSLRSPFDSSTILSSTGETAWHGPHHSAQKSTITLPPEFKTSASNVSVVALVAIYSFQRGRTRSQTRRSDEMFPGSAEIRSTDVHQAPGQTGSSGARTRAARGLGEGRDVRAAAGAQQRRTEVVVRLRPGHGQQDVARRPHRLGTHAQGRLPALQGAPRVRPALPERLRLSGAL